MFSKARESGLGIRGACRLAIYSFSIIVFFVIAQISYTNITASELARAGASIRSEANYLCIQLQDNDQRARAFERLITTLGIAPEAAKAADDAAYRLLSDSVGDVLSGYTLAETGTVAIISNGVVIASDDERLPVGSSPREVLGAEIDAAIEASVSDDQLKNVPLEGALREKDGDGDGYLLARRQGGYTVMIIEPSSMVFKDRGAILAREVLVSVAMLLTTLIMVDLLLTLMIARRIDRTNEALGRITAGELDVTVEEKGVREFRSLARGINVTVSALKGWISEAETRMDAELATAKAIQESQLPHSFPPFPDIDRFDLFASVDPAREVGGDFYDFFLLGKDPSPESGRLAFVLADVSSKGVPAALFMMKAKALLREYLVGTVDLGTAVSEANHIICDGNDTNMFVTAWIGVLDYGTGRIEYVNAGHNPPLLHHKGSWEWLKQRSGPVLGLFDTAYQVHALDCTAGDQLLLYTDGVTEAFNTEQQLYGEDRLLELLKSTAKAGVRELVETVRADVATWAEGAEQSDDITVMVLQVGRGKELCAARMADVQAYEATPTN